MQPFSKKMSQILIIGHTNITFAQTALITSYFLAIGPLHVTLNIESYFLNLKVTNVNLSQLLHLKVEQQAHLDIFHICCL